MSDEAFEQAALQWLANRGYVFTKVDIADVEVVTPPSQFSEWYELYPRKVGPGDAEKAYNKALKRGATHEILSNAVFDQLKPGNSLAIKNKKYIPHPSRWLNDSRWLEDPSERGDKEFQKPQVGGRKRDALDDWLNNG